VDELSLSFYEKPTAPLIIPCERLAHNYLVGREWMIWRSPASEFLSHLQTSKTNSNTDLPRSTQCV